jgi:hypothetical protein
VENLIYTVTFLFFCLGVVVVFMAIHARKRAVRQQAKILWVFDQANRALTLIQSENSNEVLVGLQMLSAYDIPSIRIKAFPRLMQLSHDSNSQVARLARRIIEVSQSSKFPEQNVLTKVS